MPRENEPGLPPTWLMVFGSLVIAIHLFLAFIITLSVPSGPWPVQDNVFNADPPRFTMFPSEYVAGPYQKVFKCISPFRFVSLRQEQQQVSMEALIKNKEGTVIRKMTIPDPDAPSSIRYRQKLLAHQLGSDEQMPPQQGVIIAAPGETLPMLRWWQPDGDGRFILKQDNANAVPRGQMFMQPTFSQMVIAKSYYRFLAKHNPGERVELVRCWNNPILPMILFENETPSSDILRRQTSSYGELNQ